MLSTSFEGPKTAIKSAQVYPEHSRTPYVGAEADDWPTLRINIYKIAAQEEKLSNNRQKIIEMTLFNITKDNMIVFMEI